MCSGIYMIKNMINNKVYIGQAVNIERRWNEHINDLYANRHNNKHLQRAWNKDGANNFIFNIVEECPKDELNDREIYYIAQYKAHNMKYGYNKTYGGEGVKPTDEIKAKMSKNIKKALGNPAVRVKMSKSMKEQYKNPVVRARHKKAMEDQAVHDKMSISIKKAYANPVIHDKISVLTKEEVLQIIELFVNKHYSMIKLGKMFNIGHGAIASIIDNQTFHIYDKEINKMLTKYNLTRADLKGMKRKANNKKKLSKENVLSVIDLYLHGHTQKEIAKMYNMDERNIGRLINGDTYKQYNDEIQQMIDNFYGDNVKKA
mgnify:CR=1 FL=1